MPGYAFKFNEHGTFTPEGRTKIANAEEHNRKLEAAEIANLKTHPEHVTLYISSGPHALAIITWLGTVVSDSCMIGPRRQIGFGYHTYRRSVDCRIFGARYVGWWCESSGEYVRLRKATKQ
jgi:hypothetical protein